MKTRMLAFALSILLVAGCAVKETLKRPGSTVEAPSGAQAALPTYTLGERWIRDDGAFELVRVEGDVYVFATARGSEIHLSRHLTPVKHQIAAGATWEFQPPLPLEWPLQVGKRGTSTGRFRIPHAGDGWLPAKSSWVVEAQEDIRTPAGPFRAFRVAVSIERTSDNSKYEYKTWYAPAARQFVKTESALWGFPFQVVSLDRQEAPLQVVVHEPADQTRATTDRTTVVGRVTGSVTGVVVSVNGKPVSPPEPRGAAKDTVAVNVPITLTEGRNVVLVTATDTSGKTRQEGRVVFFERPRTAATTATGSAPAAKAPAGAPLSTVPPVQIQLARPANQARFEFDSIGLAGYISGGKGLRRVGVALNGQEVWHTDPAVTTWRTVTLDVPVRLRDGQNTLVVTVVESDGVSYQEVRTVFYERRVPLTVQVTYPTTGVVVTQPSAVVAGEIKTSKGIAKASVVVNGIPVTVDDLPDGSRAVDVNRLRKEAALTIPITLAEGGNVIVIRAEEPDGTAQEEIRILTYQPPPFLLKPPSATPAVVAERWAVIVGIANYDAPGINKLRYAVNDAEAIHRVLTGPGGFKKENVLLLTDRTERKPTLRNIKWALGTFLARSAKPEDTVLIFFAGHGAPEVDQHAADPDGLTKYLVPIDADAEDLYSTALPMDEVQNVFGRIRADRTIMFIDAGYGGTADGRTFAAKRARPTAMDDRFLERVTRSRGRAIVTAAQPLEVTRELDELRHGVFTYYLVRGMEGAADGDRDGVVTLQELYGYVAREVSSKSRAAGGTQQPVLKGELDGAVPVIRISP